MRPATRISTITAAASSYSLVTLSDVKTLLGISGSGSDAFLNIAIPRASAGAQAFANNPFVVETIQDQYFPAADGFPWTLRTQIAPLQLSRWPLVSVTSVVETIAQVPTTLVAGTDFLADNKTGQLTRLDDQGFPRNWNSNPVTAVFVAGYATIPADVQDAVTRMVKSAYYAQTRDPMLRQQSSPGIYEAAYWFGSGPGGSRSGLPPDIEALLANYRVPVFA